MTDNGKKAMAAAAVTLPLITAAIIAALSGAAVDCSEAGKQARLEEFVIAQIQCAPKRAECQGDAPAASCDPDFKNATACADEVQQQFEASVKLCPEKTP